MTVCKPQSPRYFQLLAFCILGTCNFSEPTFWDNRNETNVHISSSLHFTSSKNHWGKYCTLGPPLRKLLSWAALVVLAWLWGTYLFLHFIRQPSPSHHLNFGWPRVPETTSLNHSQWCLAAHLLTELEHMKFNLVYFHPHGTNNKSRTRSSTEHHAFSLGKVLLQLRKKIMNSEQSTSFWSAEYFDFLLHLK